MSKGQFRGHYYSQLDHQQLGLLVANLPAVESAVILKLHVLAGLSRQQWDLCDGTFSVSGARMKKEELVAWLVSSTPQLTRQRALKALLSLEKTYKQIAVSRAGVVKLLNWAKVQSDSRTAGAAKVAGFRLNQELDGACHLLASYAGTVFEVDTLMDLLVAGLSKRGRKFVAPVLKELVKRGFVMPAEGGKLQVSLSLKSKPAAPSALHPPRESDGAIAHEDEDYMVTPDGVTCNQDQNHSQKREVITSHDHDGRAPGYGRGHDKSEPPKTSLRSVPGPRLDDGGGCSAEGAEPWRGRGSVPVDIWAVSEAELPAAACRILRPAEFAKTRDILASRFRKLTAYCRQYSNSGEAKASEIFRQTVQAVNSEMVSGGGKLLYPEREVYNRLGEAMGIARPERGKSVARRSR